MDPEVNLEEQKELAKKLLHGERTTPEDFEDDVARLAELVLALDEWLSKGGFLPRAWKRPGT